MRLIAIRHAETEWNRVGREMGQLDSPLSERGVAQAEALARRLATIPFDHFYSSDLGRAVATAERISQMCDKPARLDAGLRERHMGAVQGLTGLEMQARYPEICEAHARAGFYEQIPGGESAIERRDRSIRVLSEIASRHPDSTVAVVTHAGFLAGFLEFVLDLPFGGARAYATSHASLNHFEHSASGWRLDTWNDVTHLDALQVEA